jgi:hypothetical protein
MGPFATPLILLWTIGASGQPFRPRLTQAAYPSAAVGMAQSRQQGIAS